MQGVVHVQNKTSHVWMLEVGAMADNKAIQKIRKIQSWRGWGEDCKNKPTPRDFSSVKPLGFETKRKLEIRLLAENDVLFSETFQPSKPSPTFRKPVFFFS